VGQVFAGGVAFGEVCCKEMKTTATRGDEIMGFTLTWIAFRGKPDTAIHTALGLVGTGQFQEIPDAPFSGALLPSEWYVVVRDRELGCFDDEVLSKVSASCELVMCTLSETVMYSGASQWKHGRKIWSVTHDSGQGREDLQTDGELPPEFVAIRERLMESQKGERSSKPGMGVDYIFDAPIELAQYLTGYRYDQDIPGLDDDNDKPYEILEAAPSAKPQSFFRRLFGG
jgi:hypothetical protein